MDYFAGADMSKYQCRDVHSFNTSEQCSFVNDTAACQVDGGFINYTSFVYCGVAPHLLELAMVLLIFWLLILFITMGVCADNFFCPPLVVIAKYLKMSDNIAGVTLLAIGNGAPDVFSSNAAIKNAHGGDLGLAIGSLLGTGILLSHVIAGTISIMSPCHMAERPFLRDVIFFIVAVFMVFYVLYDGVITFIEGLSFVIIYCIYAIVVVAGHYIHKYRKKLNQDLNPEVEPDTNDDIDNDDPANIQALRRPDEDPDINYTQSEHMPLLRHEEPHTSPLNDFLCAISPVRPAEFKVSKIPKKVYLIIKAPTNMILQLAIPVVDYSKPKNGWNRHLNSLHCVVTPLITILVASHDVFLYKINGKFPVYALLLIAGTLLAIVVFCTSKNNQPPFYHAVFAVMGFGAAVIWTDAIASEIVNILTTFGIVFNISNAILGLTLLSWGNSVADFVADVIMARKGYPRTGMSACYGGPLFNIMLGLGVPFIIMTAHGSSQVSVTIVQVVLVCFLLVSLSLQLVVVPLLKFTTGKVFGIYLLLVYALFLFFVLLAETGVLKGHF